MKPALYLALPLLFCGCRTTPWHAPADARLAAFIPADTVLLAGIAMDELKNTPLYQRVAPQFGPLAQEGFDPRRDVRELLIASDGKRTVALARGRFQARELEDAEKQEYRGYPIYARGDQGVALIDGSTALAGNTGMLRAAIDQERSGGRPGSGLLARARSLPTPKQMWLVSSGTVDFLSRGIPENPNAAVLVRLLRSISDLEGYADLRTGLTGSISGRAPADEDARFLGDSVRGLIGLARLSIPREEADVIRALDQFSVQQTERTVTVSANVPAELAEKLMERLPAFSEESRRPGWSRRPR